MDESPIVMLNLLRFRHEGRERYRRYVTHLRETGVSARYGTEVVFQGHRHPPLVAEAGRAWDMVLLVRYPSSQALLVMVRDADYLAGAHHRSAALRESVLEP